MPNGETEGEYWKRRFHEEADRHDESRYVAIRLSLEIEDLKAEIQRLIRSNPITMPYNEANERFSAQSLLQEDDDFFEEDEPVADVEAAFKRGRRVPPGHEIELHETRIDGVHWWYTTCVCDWESDMKHTKAHAHACAGKHLDDLEGSKP